MEWRIRPIDEWPGERTHSPRRAPFDSPWGKTLRLLDEELRKLKAENLILMRAVSDDDIRLDGNLRAGVKPAHEGVILAFDSKYGALKYACDAFLSWGDNLRAIALGLEALRKVERYGISRRGEQYTGYRALPASSEGAMTKDVAAGILAKWGGFSAEAIAQFPEVRDAAYLKAAKATHPDVGGNEEDFKLVARAAELLRTA
jgi:hypothetical protein